MCRPHTAKVLIEEVIESYRDTAGASAVGGGPAEPHLS
jgi:hypothetical protein